MGVFSPDSEFMGFLSKVTDFIILNILCLLLSIPIVTIGAAFTAKNYVAMKIVRGEEPDAVKSFFKSFRENFKQATIIWCGFLAALVILAFDGYNVVFGMAKNMPSIGKIALAIMSFFVWGIVYCSFYMMARFHISNKELIKGSLAMMLLNLPYMIVIFFVTFVPYIICAWYIEWGLGIWILCTTASLYYISRGFDRQFNKILGGQKSESEEIGNCAEPDLKRVLS